RLSMHLAGQAHDAGRYWNRGRSCACEGSPGAGMSGDFRPLFLPAPGAPMPHKRQAPHQAGLVVCRCRRRTRPEQGGSVIPRRAPTLKLHPDYVAFGRSLSIPCSCGVTLARPNRDRVALLHLFASLGARLPDRLAHARAAIVAAAVHRWTRLDRRALHGRPRRGGKRAALHRRGALLADAVQVTPRRAVAVLPRPVVVRMRPHHDRRPVAGITVVIARIAVRSIPAAVTPVWPVAVAAPIADVAVVAVVGGRVAVVVVAAGRIAVAVAGAHAPAQQQHRQRGEQEFADHGVLSPDGSGGSDDSGAP